WAGSRAGLHAHKPGFQAQPLPELGRDVVPVLDQQIDQLPAVDQADARKSRLESNLGSGALVVRSSDESALSAKRDRLPQLAHRVRAYLRSELVPLSLHKNLYLRQVRDVQLPCRVNAAVAGFANDLRAF